MAAARTKLLQAAAQLSRLGLQDGFCRQLGSLAGGPGVPGALPAPGRQRGFSNEADASTEASAAPSPEAVERQGRPRPPTRHAQQGRYRKELFVPSTWEQKGAADAEHPLVQEMHRLVNANDAEGARRAFDAALAPLETQLAQGAAPAPEELPPPFAWKLYFASLAACNAHPFRLNSRLHLMKRLGVAPQAACFVTTLKCMARQGLGSQAYTVLREMQSLGLSPTLHCYLFTIGATLRQRPPELGYAHELLGEVKESELVQYSSHKAQLGKLLLQAAREFAGHRRFSHAFEALDWLEELGLRVPAFVVADITHLATAAEAPEHLLECVRRLERATQTYQLSADAAPVTRPLKVEEGLLLNVLQLAASKGHVPLAEATWQLLERSVALHNTPGPALLKYTKGAEEQQPEAAGSAAEDAAAAAQGGGLDSEVSLVSDDDEEAAAAQRAATDSRQLEVASEELEASDAAAAEREDAAHNAELLRRAERRGVHAAPDWTAESAAAEVAAMAAEQWGARKPSLMSFCALIHAYAKANQNEAMLLAIHKLLEDRPDERDEAAYHCGLPIAVDSLARSVEACDAAFDVLEGWAQAGQPVHVEQLNVLVAAYSQMGDLKRAFATVDAYPRLAVEPNADTYNALMEGCLASGRVSTARDVHGMMLAAGRQGNERTHELLVEAGIVSGEVEAMMYALQDLQAAGFTPKARLLERCVARAERAGDRAALRQLLEQLFAQDYRIVGVDAKARRWQVEGGMEVLTGSSKLVSREEVAWELRKHKAIATRVGRRRQQQQQQQQQQPRRQQDNR